jgi:exopolyphosphatase/guanosine-5'-triphosphate,3'-diphosphate pyrophosphatase
VAQAGSEQRSLEALFQETAETRISGGLCAERPELTEANMKAGLASIEQLLRQAQRFEPADCAIVATSAVREAANGRAFTDKIANATGKQVQILSGLDEARFVGQGLRCDPALGQHSEFFQVDLGGGSLELIRFEAGHPTAFASLPLGAVRLTDRFVADPSLPLGPEEERALRGHVEATLSGSGFALHPGPGIVVATGGAFTVCRAVLAAQDGLPIEQSSAELSRTQLQTLCDQLKKVPLAERLRVPRLPAARADILPTALITIDQLLETCGRRGLTHSFYNLRHGIAAHLLFEAPSHSAPGTHG